MNKDMVDLYIPTFYSGHTIFITGVTGFLGKILLEKLLRSCPNIAEIYLLIRPKKGMDINERFKKMLDNKVFDKIRSEQPSAFDKLIPIVGDVHSVGLGLQAVDRQTLIEKVSIVFHAAASVRFDDDLKTAIFNNTRSTRDICILAQDMKKLVALVHVSSTYSQSDKIDVYEIPYSFDVDWKQMIQIAENIDEHILNTFTAKCLGSIANTYIFSKRLAEQVINDYSKSLPCVIIRPSIVISATEEPIKGWLDNFNGPVGTFVGGGKGILRVMYMDPMVNCDYMPVDVCVKIIIIAAWKRGMKSITEDNTTHVYNNSAHLVKFMCGKDIIKMAFTITKEIPLEKILWSPYTIITKNYTKYYILMLLLHILPAIFVDAILKLLHMRPMLLKLQRKIFITNNALSYFLLHTWKFHNDKMLNLLTNLSVENKKEFGFEYENFNPYNYFKDALIGAKINLLNEDMNNLETAKLHRKRMDWLDQIIRILCSLIILWIFYRYMLSYITKPFLPLFA